MFKVPSIPQLLKLKNVKPFIKRECVKMKFDNIPDNFDEKKIDWKLALDKNDRRKRKLKSLKKIVEFRGGRLLSDMYVSSITPLECLCRRGHKWNPTSSSIMQGTWCPDCVDLDEKELRIKEKYSSLYYTRIYKDSLNLPYEQSLGVCLY